MYEEKYKKDYIQIRLPQPLKQEYQSLCKEHSINSSELLRQFISRWIEENRDRNIL